MRHEMTSLYVFTFYRIWHLSLDLHFFMSRASPFPTTPRRPRSPPASANSNGSFQPSLPTSTRPLQIRPSRPTTPGNTSLTSSTQRPRRSEDRPRQVSDYSVSGASTSTRSDRRVQEEDSVSTAKSDNPQVSGYRYHNGSPGVSSSTGSSMSRTERQKAKDPELSPTAMPAVLSAFQAAGRRRRAMTNGSDEIEYEKERRKEQELQNTRQQRIREKIPGRRMNGKARAGDIDGEFLFVKSGHAALFSLN
jgi:exocyst complex component 4